MFNQTVLITGAAKRIGATLAKYLHHEGMNVIVHYHRSAKEANELVRDMNKARHDSAITIQADLSHKEYYEAIIDTALQFKGGLDVLINNASAFYPTPISDMTDEDWLSIMDINLKAPLFLSQLAAPTLRKNKGCIINLTDIHALRPLAKHSIYSMSKSGLTTLTQSLAKELAPSIRVNALAPGAILWPENIEETEKQAILKQIPMQKIGDPEQIAKAAVFLIKDANYITGQIINVDGGRSLFSG
ncbi:MAG: pteridine reductase [Pseudomonadota bacterium]